jgi:hypothetical protein
MRKPAGRDLGHLNALVDVGNDRSALSCVSGGQARRHRRELGVFVGRAAPRHSGPPRSGQMSARDPLFYADKPCRGEDEVGLRRAAVAAEHPGDRLLSDPLRTFPAGDWPAAHAPLRSLTPVDSECGAVAVGRT